MKNDPTRDEQARQLELESYHIMDTLSEKDYDDITTLASIICDTPVALITLIDGERQWFKARKGTDVTEMPREISFCTHAIEDPERPMIVKDSRLDDRFKNNPLVTHDPNIVFYAGVPLLTKNGFGLGTVCIIDIKPRDLSDEQIGALKILSDQVMKMLELNKLNHELSFHSKDLEQNIADRIREVAQKNIALEKMNKELESFAFISSHDLQEPLRKIQTFISIIEDRESENLSVKGREYLSKMHESSFRMSALIRDLLAYSRSTGSVKEFKEIEISTVVRDVQHDLSEETEKLKARIILKSDTKIAVIPFQFRQLIYNLISNALKFSHPSRKSVISIGSTVGDAKSFGIEKMEEGKSYVRITVEDNGIGFDNQYREKIFELFQRLDSTRSKYGTGIGLAIVKKIVDNHEGFIAAKSKINEGTIFEIYLPQTS